MKCMPLLCSSRPTAPPLPLPLPRCVSTSCASARAPGCEKSHKLEVHVAKAKAKVHPDWMPVNVDAVRCGSKVNMDL